MKGTERILSLVSLIFGAVAALASALTLTATVAAANTEQWSRMPSSISPYLFLLWCPTLFFGVTLFVVGIGVYQERPWAWTAAFRWSVGALAFLPFQLWLQVGVIAPRTHAALAAMDTNSLLEPAAPMTQGEWIFVIARHVLIYGPLPVVLLVLSTRARNKAVALA